MNKLINKVEIEIGNKTIKIDATFEIDNADAEKHEINGQKLILNNLPKVKDVLRYRIKRKKGCFIKEGSETRGCDFINSKYFDKNPTENNNTNNIVLILESPHKDEFTSNFTPIAPAQGSTGKNIDNHIAQVLTCIDCKLGEENKLKGGQYNLIISNPVQFQASLDYFTTKKTKNKKDIKLNVWNSLWNNKDIKNDFKNRIESYKAILIINACTKGEDKINGIKPKQSITNFISEKFSKITVIEAHHPSQQWNMSCYGIRIGNRK